MATTKKTVDKYSRFNDDGYGIRPLNLTKTTVKKPTKVVKKSTVKKGR